MPEPSLFLKTLFLHNQLVRTQTCPPALDKALWDCKMGIFSNAAVVHGGESEKLLQGMMVACKLTPADWKIFPKEATYQSIIGLKQINCLLLLGSSEKELNMEVQFPYYKPVFFAGKNWVKAHALETLLKEVDFKKQLWNHALKPLFG